MHKGCIIDQCHSLLILTKMTFSYSYSMPRLV